MLKGLDSSVSSALLPATHLSWFQSPTAAFLGSYPQLWNRQHLGDFTAMIGFIFTTLVMPLRAYMQPLSPATQWLASAALWSHEEDFASPLHVHPSWLKQAQHGWHCQVWLPYWKGSLPLLWVTLVLELFFSCFFRTETFLGAPLQAGSFAGWGFSLKVSFTSFQGWVRGLSLC